MIAVVSTTSIKPDTAASVGFTFSSASSHITLGKGALNPPVVNSAIVNSSNDTTKANRNAEIKPGQMIGSVIRKKAVNGAAPSMAAIDTCNLRINELGGIRNTVAAVRICEMYGLGYRFSAFGPQLTAAHALHLASAFPGTHAACDVGEYLQLLDDPFEGLVA